jgi:hypothetical protein
LRESTEVCFDFTLCKALSADEEQRDPRARQRVSVIGPGHACGPDIALGRRIHPVSFILFFCRKEATHAKTLSTLKDKINNALVVDRENHIYRCHALYLPTRSCLNLK